MSVFAYPPPAGTPSVTIDLMPHLADSISQGGEFFNSGLAQVSLPSVDVVGGTMTDTFTKCVFDFSGALQPSYAPYEIYCRFTGDQYFANDSETYSVYGGYILFYTAYGEPPYYSDSMELTSPLSPDATNLNFAQDNEGIVVTGPRPIGGSVLQTTLDISTLENDFGSELTNDGLILAFRSGGSNTWGGGPTRTVPATDNTIQELYVKAYDYSSPPRFWTGFNSTSEREL